MESLGPEPISDGQVLTIHSPVFFGTNTGAVQVGNNSPLYLYVDAGKGKQILPPLASANYNLPHGMGQITIEAHLPATGTIPPGSPSEVFTTWYNGQEAIPPPLPLPPLLSVPVVALPADHVVVGTATTPVVGAMLSGDVDDRVILDPSGLLIGPGGSTPPDVRYGRFAAGVAWIQNGNLRVDLGVAVRGVGVSLVQGTGGIIDSVAGDRIVVWDGSFVYLGDIDNLGIATEIRSHGATGLTVDTSLVAAFTTALQVEYGDNGGTSHFSKVFAIHDTTGALDYLVGPNGSILYVTHS